MALDFPNSPTAGQVFAVSGATWTWDGVKWTASTSGGPSSTLPLMNGTAAVGTGTTWARADHVHPVDTSRYAASNPSGYQTAAQVTASLGNYLPLAGGTVTGALNVNQNLGVGSGISCAGTFSANSGVINCSVVNGGTNPTVALLNAGNSPLSQWIANPTGGAVTINSNVAGGAIALVGDVQAQPGAGHNFVVTPGIGYQTGGGSWGALSDARIKTVEGDYGLGLDAVLALRPVVYRYNGNDSFAEGEPSMHAYAAEQGQQFVGLVAQEVEAVFPGMVSQREGWIDGEKVDDLRNLNNSELVYALVNAVKELKAEIEALKAAR